MSIKHLLLYMDHGPGTEGRLQAALALADRFGAQITALCLIAEPLLRGTAGRHLPAEIIREHVSHAEAEATTLLEGARAAAGRRGVVLEIVRESGSADRLPQLLARHARHTDLTVIGQPDLDTNGVDDALLVEAGFMDSGHAALIVPRAGVPQLPPRSALIAWDGSREAARATTDALPLLRHAERTVILVVDADAMGGRVGAPPGADLAAHLSRHQVKAEVKLVASGSAGIADVLLAQVRDSQADLLVMGGYGHSRLREMLLGGVTRHMLERMTVPLLISH